MTTGGFVVFHRKITEWEWYTKPNMLSLFFHLIVMANHKDQKWQGIEVKRGQLVTGRLALSKQLGISEKKIRTCLERLKETGEITVKSANRFSIITVCKYEDYQTQEKEMGQQRASKGPAKGQQRATNNNVNNENNENKTTTTKPQAAKASFDALAFRPAFIREDLWKALLENRKFKRLQNSELALKVICKQFLLAVEAGYDIEDCIGTYISSGWQTFKPEYMKPRGGGNQPGPGKSMSVKEKHARALLEVQ